MNLQKLIAAAIECGRHDVNRDTCGVCGDHFDECEAESLYEPAETGDEFVRIGFACPGARVREALAEEEP